MKETFRHYLFEGMLGVSPILREIQFSTQPEGTEGSYEREDGVIKEIDYQHLLVERELSSSEAQGLPPEHFLEIASEAGREMGEKMLANLLESVNTTTEEVGNVVNLQGQDLTFEKFLELSEKVETDFDEDGRPRRKSLLMNPGTLASFEKSMAEWQKDPEKRAAMEAVVRKHKADYDEREACRRMVD